MSLRNSISISKKSPSSVELVSSSEKEIAKSLGEKEKAKSLSTFISDLQTEILVNEVSVPNIEESNVELREIENNYMYLSEFDEKAFKFNSKVRTLNIQQPILKNLTSDNPFEQACLDFYQQNLYSLQYEENTSIKIPNEGEFKDFKLFTKRDEPQVHPNNFFSL